MPLSPAPWTTDPDHRYTVIDASGGNVCLLPVSTADNNRAAILALPDLLAALKALVACRDRDEAPQGSHWQTARAALAKASPDTKS